MHCFVKSDDKKSPLGKEDNNKKQPQNKTKSRVSSLDVEKTYLLLLKKRIYVSASITCVTSSSAM